MPACTCTQIITRGVAGAVAGSTQTPTDLAALLTLGAYATTVAGIVEVQVKDDYREPTNLWLAVALPPGERKTAVVEHVTKPLEEWEAEQARLLEPVIA